MLQGIVGSQVDHGRSKIDHTKGRDICHGKSFAGHKGAVG
jgi:hypothetical protein